MRPWLNLLLLAFFFLGSCAPAYPFLSTVEVSQTPQTVLPLSTPTPLPSPTPTFTPSPTATPAPTPTDTPLPPLVPPTLEPLAPPGQPGRESRYIRRSQGRAIFSR
jgi:hypothetical protein